VHCRRPSLLAYTTIPSNEDSSCDPIIQSYTTIPSNEASSRDPIIQMWSTSAHQKKGVRAWEAAVSPLHAAALGVTPTNTDRETDLPLKGEDELTPGHAAQFVEPLPSMVTLVTAAPQPTTTSRADGQSAGAEAAGPEALLLLQRQGGLGSDGGGLQGGQAGGGALAAHGGYAKGGHLGAVGDVGVQNVTSRAWQSSWLGQWSGLWSETEQQQQQQQEQQQQLQQQQAGLGQQQRQQLACQALQAVLGVSGDHSGALHPSTCRAKQETFLPHLFSLCTAQLVGATFGEVGPRNPFRMALLGNEQLPVLEDDSIGSMVSFAVCVKLT
jgi:hypothetical protein